MAIVLPFFKLLYIYILIGFIFQDIGFKYGPLEAGLLKFIIHTKVGAGPEVLNDSSQHLLSPETGLPKRLNTS